MLRYKTFASTRLSFWPIANFGKGRAFKLVSEVRPVRVRGIIDMARGRQNIAPT